MSKLATILLLFIFSAVVVSSLVSPRDHHSSEAALLMDLLARQYIPKCLRVRMDTGETKDLITHRPTPRRPHTQLKTGKMLGQESVTRSSKSTAGIRNPINPESEPQPQIFINQEMFPQSQKALRFIIDHSKRVLQYSCIIYMLPRHPDPRLLPIITDSASGNKLIRYFFLYAQNATDAEHFLLDKRLGKEENVAALTHQESQNKTNWRVLIRQLLHPSGFPQVLSVNKWSTDTGLANTNDIFPDQMTNFYGTMLRGVALSYKPFVDYRTVQGSLVVQPKPCVDIFTLDAIAEKLNFTYEIASPVDGQWGYLKDDGYFTGIVGDIQLGRANFSLNLNVILKRSLAIDFTRIYFLDPMTFITAKSPPSVPWRKLLTPFTGSVWIVVVVSVGGGALLYHVIYTIQDTLASSHHPSSHAIMHVLASFLTQPLFYFPRLSSGKVFMGFWFVYTFLVTTYYKTSLTSTFAVPVLPPSIDTLQQLYESDVTYGISAAKGVTYQLFSTSDIPLYQKMFIHMAYNSYTDSMRLAAEGSYAYIGFKTPLTFQMILHNNKPNRRHDLHVAPEESFPGGYAWALPKAGLINKWLSDMFALQLKEPQETQDEQMEEQLRNRDDRQEVVLNLNHLQGPFFMFFIGSAGGVMLLLLELTWAWMNSV